MPRTANAIDSRKRNPLIAATSLKTVIHTHKYTKKQIQNNKQGRWYTETSSERDLSGIISWPKWVHWAYHWGGCHWTIVRPHCRAHSSSSWGDDRGTIHHHKSIGSFVAIAAEHAIEGCTLWCRWYCGLDSRAKCSALRSHWQRHLDSGRLDSIGSVDAIAWLRKRGHIRPWRGLDELTGLLDSLLEGSKKDDHICW